MAVVSLDGQSLQIDGRRVWLVGGQVAYWRLPASRWADRIDQARQAGLNALTVNIPWAVHEPSQGRFHFDGQADVRSFLQLAIQQGMMLIVRPGPYAGDDLALGGMPGWLLGQEGMALRQGTGPFLQAVGSYFAQLMRQIEDLQVTHPAQSHADAPGRAGIVLMQVEHLWRCHHPQQGEQYLAQLARYLRENHCTVPLTLSNQFWQQVDGLIDTWAADTHLAADLRQLGQLQPEAPRIASDLGTSSSPEDLALQVAGVLGVGGQFSLTDFDHGITPGLLGRGRRAAVTSLIDPHGQPADHLQAIRPLCMFASQFEHVLAHAQQRPAFPAVDPQSQGQSLSVLHQHGPQGSVTFLLRSQQHKAPHADIMLPDGQSVRIDLGKDRVAWFASGVNLPGAGELTLTNLRPWAWHGQRMLVLFGAAGANGFVSINDSPLDVHVPSAKQRPTVLEHQDVTLVILNEQQIEHAVLTPEGLLAGTANISLQGQVTSHRQRPASKTTKPRLQPWRSIEAQPSHEDWPRSLEETGIASSLQALAPEAAWGWYELSLKKAVPASAKLACPASGSDLQIFSPQGKPLGVLPAQQVVAQAMPASVQLLARAIHHDSDTWAAHLPDGLAGPIVAITPVKLPKPLLQAHQPVPDPLAYAGYLRTMRHQPRLTASVVTWRLSLRSKAMRLFTLADFPLPAMLIVNDQIAGVYHPQLSHGKAVFELHMERQLTRGMNTLTLALIQDASNHTITKDMLNHVSLYEAKQDVTAGGTIRFSPLSLPDAADFEANNRTKPAATPGHPAWHRTTFRISSPEAASLALQLKHADAHGAVWLNRQPVDTFRPGDSSRQMALPASWLHDDKPNELLVFIEQSPSTFKASLA